MQASTNACVNGHMMAFLVADEGGSYRRSRTQHTHTQHTWADTQTHRHTDTHTHNATQHTCSNKGHSPRLGRRFGFSEEELPPRGDLVDDTLAITMIYDNQVALHRCAVIAPKLKVAEWCFRLFVELLDGLCKEHLGYALWYGLKALPPRKVCTPLFAQVGGGAGGLVG